jgi:hypothetical protein
MHRCTTQSAGQIIGQVAGLQVIGLDIAKACSNFTPWT